MKSLINKIKKNWQGYFNIYLFLNFLGWCGWQAYKVYIEGRLDFVEGTFILHNAILTTIIVVRIPFKAIDKNYFNQGVALLAFFSGALFMGQQATTDPSLILTSKIVLSISHILGIITLLNLGTSFGIMISYRKIKTKGLYSFVRHPMYGTDILLRVGFLISHFNTFTVIAFIVSTSFYIYRATCEEKFLSLQPEYVSYMKKVKYRFIPFVF